MSKRIGQWFLDHWETIAIVWPLIVLVILVYSILTCAAIGDESISDVTNADYVLYTADGEMKAVENSVIVDMNNGYQYIVFEIDGQYVAAPSIAEDGTVYKTVE